MASFSDRWSWTFSMAQLCWPFLSVSYHLKTFYLCVYRRIFYRFLVQVFYHFLPCKCIYRIYRKIQFLYPPLALNFFFVLRLRLGTIGWYDPIVYKAIYAFKIDKWALQTCYTIMKRSKAFIEHSSKRSGTVNGWKDKVRY